MIPEARASIRPLVPAEAGTQRRMSGRRPAISFHPRGKPHPMSFGRPSAASFRWIPAYAGMSGERTSRMEA